MKNLFLVIISFVLILSTIGLSAESAFASESVNSTTSVQEEDLESFTVIVEYDKNQEPISETIINESDMEVTPHLESETPSGGFSTFYIPIEGGISYKLIDSFNGTSKVIDTLGEWISQFAAAVIPVKFTKNLWSSSAGTATYNTFHKPPSTRYYTTKIYEDSDSYYYYGKVVAYEYSDSARKKLTKTMTHVSKVRK
jgi:hypothetical protein